MSAEYPGSLAEWQQHIAALDEDALWEAARAANTASFVQQLQDEGATADDIHGVLILFARRLHALGLRPPGDGYLDLIALATLPDPLG